MGGLVAVRGWVAVTRVWLFGCGCDEKNIVPGPRCLTGVCQVMQRIGETFITPMWNFALFPSLLMQGDVQVMQRIWGTFTMPMWNCAFFPSLVSAFEMRNIP